MNRRVDQKLHLAGLALAAIDSASSLKKTPAIETALVESALFHLHIAYRAYLHELLLQCKLSRSENTQVDSEKFIETAQQAAAVLESQHMRSSDIDELVHMERSGAWLAQLHAAYAAAASVGIAAEPAARTDIVLHDMTAHVDAETLAGWMHQFQTLLRRQREHAQEW